MTLHFLIMGIKQSVSPEQSQNPEVPQQEQSQNPEVPQQEPIYIPEPSSDSDEFRDFIQKEDDRCLFEKPKRLPLMPEFSSSYSEGYINDSEEEEYDSK